MRIRFSEEFRREYKKIRDSSLRKRLLKVLKKLKERPEAGKPLKYGYKGKRRIRIGHFRLVYSIEGDILMVSSLQHRKKAYKNDR